MKKSDITMWKEQFSSNIVITYIESEEKGNSGDITSQSIPEGTHIKSLNGNSIVLTIIK